MLFLPLQAYGIWPDPIWAEQVLTLCTHNLHLLPIMLQSIRFLAVPLVISRSNVCFPIFQSAHYWQSIDCTQAQKMLSSFIWFSHSVFSNCYTPNFIIFTHFHIPVSNYSQTSWHCTYCTLQFIIKAVYSFFWSGIYAILLQQCWINWWTGMQGNGIELNVILFKYRLRFNSFRFGIYWFSQKATTTSHQIIRYWNTLHTTVCLKCSQCRW